jgi:hypothetical protein
MAEEEWVECPTCYDGTDVAGDLCCDCDGFGGWWQSALVPAVVDVQLPDGECG